MWRWVRIVRSARRSLATTLKTPGWTAGSGKPQAAAQQLRRWCTVSRQHKPTASHNSPSTPPQFFFQKANKEKKESTRVLYFARCFVPVRALVSESPPPPNCRAPAGHDACAAFGRQASRSTTEARAAPTRGREEHRAVQGFLPSPGAGRRWRLGAALVLFPVAATPRAHPATVQTRDDTIIIH